MPAGSICLFDMRATNVYQRNEGALFGTTDPQLWVYEGQANMASLQKARSCAHTPRTAQHSMARHGTAQHSTARHSIVQRYAR